jgi:tRNA G46 methylase TrmB
VSADWRPPPPLPPSSPERVRGALGGSLLFEQPALAAERARFEAFVAGPEPLGVEVGFDHGMRILERARRQPDWRWLGVELRRARVEAAAPHAPEGCLLWRADARAVFAALMPPGRVSLVEVYFPTPTDNPRHLLVGSLARALAPDGRLVVVTDVLGLHEHVGALLQGWREAEEPPPAGVLSRRERVCRRDGLPVYRRCVSPPSGALGA